MTMEDFFIYTGMGILIAMFPVLYCAARGPSAVDRILSVNIVGTKTMLFLVITGTIFKRVDMFVDLAITYALLNFIGSLAAAKFFRRRRSIEVPPLEAEIQSDPDQILNK